MIIQHEQDLGYVIAYTVEEYRVAFKLYDVVGYELSGDDLGVETPMFDSAKSPGGTTALDDAEVFLEGWVKWDGCSDWKTEQGYFHRCSRRGLYQIGLVLDKCWCIARDQLPTFLDC